VTGTIFRECEQKSGRRGQQNTEAIRNVRREFLEAIGARFAGGGDEGSSGVRDRTGENAVGKILAVVLAAAAGLLVAGGLGFVAGEAPVFHWEMAGLVVALLAAAGGAVAAGSGAGSGKPGVGAAVGSLLTGMAFVLLSIGEQHPVALTFWGVVVVAVAAGVAGAVGGGIGKWFAGT
jgi:hypothetical protein